MNARELETQHNLKKWAAIIKECRSSGMKILIQPHQRIVYPQQDVFCSQNDTVHFTY